jgi:hypothetical protein
MNCTVFPVAGGVCAKAKDAGIASAATKKEKRFIFTPIKKGIVGQASVSFSMMSEL